MLSIEADGGRVHHYRGLPAHREVLGVYTARGIPMNVEWWHWMAVGLVLVVLEIAAPGGFFVIFFGLAAMVVGGLVLFDMGGSLAVQLLLFSVLSAVFLLLFRNPLLRRMKFDRGTDEI
ncbi:MAG: NfeD family protein, partial [Acidobacteria bacterium]|nr:NfeD family protein [Acidobacteriota bacterium]